MTQRKRGPGDGLPSRLATRATPQAEPAAGSGSMAGWLHNMSARATATVSHSGQHACDLVRFSAPRPLPAGRSVVAAWCALLGLRCACDEEGLRNLQGALDRDDPRRLAALPPVAAVTAPIQAELRPGVSDDPWLVAAVLCRSSDKVFLRGKAPLVTEASLNRDIALALVPRNPRGESDGRGD